MATDIRIDVEFFGHPKTVKLRHRLGLEGIISLLKLWMWAAKNRPEGTLYSMDKEDVEISAGWEGEPGAFTDALIALRWLDVEGEGTETTYILHDWQDHNEWVAGAVNRGDRARFARMAATYPALYRELVSQGRESITRAEYLSLTKDAPTQILNGPLTNVNAPSTPPPVPPPVPVPVPDPNKKDTPVEGKGQDLLAKAQRCLDILKSFKNFRAHTGNEDIRWIVSLYQNPKNIATDIYKELLEARQWAVKKGMEVKNPKAFFLDWLDNLHKSRR